MVCKKCGAEMEENAFFCGKCGARADGRAPCEKCGKLNAEDALYCGSCGYRLDGKIVCKSCGKTAEGKNAFCVFCGSSLKEELKQKEEPKQKEVVAATSPAKKNDPWAAFGYKRRASERAAKPKEKSLDKLLNERTEKLFSTVGSAILLFGALLSLLFVFFIGMEFSVKNVGESTNSLAGILQTLDAGKGQNIFFFFGDCQEMFDGWNMYAVVGAGVAVVTLAVVIICSLIAGIAFVRGFLYDDVDEKRAATVNATAAIVGYLAGVVAFYACTRQSAVLLGVKETTTLNLMTKIGVVLAIVACVFGVLLCVIGRGRAYWTQMNAIPVGYTVLGLGVVVVALIFGANVAFNATWKSANLSLDMNYPMTTVIIDALFVGDSLPTATLSPSLTKVEELLNSIKSANNWAQLFLVLFILFASLAVRLSIEGLTSEAENSFHVFAAVGMVLFSGLTLLCSTIVGNGWKSLITELGGTTEGLSMRLSAHIFCFLFSIGYLVVHILRIREEKVQIQLEHWLKEQQLKEGKK